MSGREVRFAAKTIERWLYRARQERDDPVGVLRRAVRKDCGKVSLKPELIECLANQYHEYPHWTYQLHYDNLQARVKADAKLGPLQSYSTVRRYMVAEGMVRKPRLKPKKYPGELRAAQRGERREIRSYEAEYVGACGTSTSITARYRWSRRVAFGSGRWLWASWMITRGTVLTCSGICPRPRRISCMASPREFRSADCRGPR